MFDRQTANAINQSVQTAEVNTTKPAMQTDGAWDWYGIVEHPEIISAWGNKKRDRELRALSYAVHNGLFQGAAAGLIMRWQTVPWEIKGGRNLVRAYQEMLAYQWEEWIGKIGWDFLTQDFGAVSEIIGGGRADKPLTGRVLMIDHMDSLSCFATKNAEFPLIYWNEENGSMHHMHDSRVHRFVDMTSPKRMAYGTGLCALSRYLSEANVDILLGRHDNEMLNDLPPAGLLTVTGVQEGQWMDILGKFETDRRADGQNIFRNTMVMFSVDPTREVKANIIPFSVLPEGFDTKAFVDVHVNKLALALGVDPQDIWPLSGQALGTGTQSEILASKARGKMFGRFLQMVTRFINYKVLPDGLEFQFKFKDAEEDGETATTAKVWVDIANTANFLSDEEKRKLLAAQVEAIRDVITDENGEVVALPDDDPKQDDQEIIAPDDNPLAAAADQSAIQANLQGEASPAGRGNDGSGTSAPEDISTVPANRNPDDRNKGLVLDGRRVYHVARKEYTATKEAFTADVAVYLSDAAAGVITPAAFAIRMRQAINQYGKAAYLDGLESGGVTEMDETDSETFAGLLAAQSAFVTGARSGITDFTGDADSRAQLWQKTLDPFYYAGVESADKNGMYTFDGEDGDESCKDCVRLKGTSHRMSWWVKNEMRPVVDGHNFECGGWRCQHKLTKKAK